MLHRSIRETGCIIAIFALLHVSAVARDARRVPAYWPQWRGPQRDDVATDKGLLPAWPEGGPPLIWTGTGLGDGYSSVVINEGRIYTTGDRKDGEYLICVDDATGKELWSTRIGDAWKDGGARSTPTTDGKSVYALTAQGDLICV